MKLRPTWRRHFIIFGIGVSVIALALDRAGSEENTAAADSKKFSDQLALVKPWQPKRLVWNTSPFFFSNRKLPFDPTGLTTMEAGGYNALLGKAYTEMAAASVSMHKSQGVGSPARRGARTEYFKWLAGEPMNGGLFDGVDTTWKRVANS
jgi:hypothetical protein